MGAVTALLYAAKHHDLAGMVVDSPFANLPQLVQELAVSDYVGLRVVMGGEGKRPFGVCQENY